MWAMGTRHRGLPMAASDSRESDSWENFEDLDCDEMLDEWRANNPMVDDKEWFEADTIVEHWDDPLMYRVAWKGYGKVDDSWLLPEDLDASLIVEYWNRDR